MCPSMDEEGVANGPTGPERCIVDPYATKVKVATSVRGVVGCSGSLLLGHSTGIHENLINVGDGHVTVHYVGVESVNSERP